MSFTSFDVESALCPFSIGAAKLIGYATTCQDIRNRFDIRNRSWKFNYLQ